MDLEAFQSQDFRNDYRLANLFALIPSCGGTVLDVGAGNGVIAYTLLEGFDRVVLGDVSERVVEALSARHAGDPRVEVRQLDAQDFELEDEVDLITSCDVLEHLEHDEDALRCFHDNLKPGGRLFVAVPAIPALYGKRDSHYGHFRRYSRGELQVKIARAGFEEVELRYWNLLGVLPYFVAEKVLRRHLVGPARVEQRTLRQRLINRALHAILAAERRTRHLPAGLTLIATARRSSART